MKLFKLVVLVFLGLTAFVHPFLSFAAEASDGLDSSVRKQFYSSKTAFAARYDLVQINPQIVKKTIRGLFDEASWSYVSKDAEEWTSGSDVHFTTIDALVTAGIKQVTQIAIDNGSLNQYGVMQLPPGTTEESFGKIKKDLSTHEGFDTERIQNFAVIHRQGVANPSAASYSKEIEAQYLQGFSQAVPGATISWVSVPNDNFKVQLGDVLQDEKIAALISRALYVGGYFVGGDRPEIALYLNFPLESHVDDFKMIFDKYLKNTLDEAMQEDKLNELAGATPYLTTQAMYQQIIGAIKTKASGKTFFIILDTASLRKITSALVNHYIREK